MSELLTTLPEQSTQLPEVYAIPGDGYLGRELKKGYAVRRGYTDASVAAAETLWQSPLLDSDIAELFDGGDHIRDAREDQHKRAQLATLLNTKLQKLLDEGKLPSRIQANTRKGPKVAGYPYDVSSRNYAVLLALSMLDGTFHGQLNPEGDEIEYDANGRAVVGQHRAAALQLLENDKQQLK